MNVPLAQRRAEMRCSDDADRIGGVRHLVFRALLVLVLVLQACADCGSASCGGGLGDALERSIAHRGRIAVYPEGPRRAVEGVEFISAERIPGFIEALAADDFEALAEALARGGVRGLLIERDLNLDGSLGELSRGLATPPFRALFLDSNASYFEFDQRLDLPASYRAALAKTARMILGGVPRPPLAYFPEMLREVRSVEVMVLLSESGRPRLWRSARAGSIASALLMASEAARDRWNERAEAMGGPLHAILPRLDLEVAFLVEDGDFLDRRPSVIARQITADHGVGYEQTGSWRYLLPERLDELGEERRTRAFSLLFEENGLPDSALSRSDLRLYRLRVHRVGFSPAPARAERRGSSAPVQIKDAIGKDFEAFEP